MRTAASRCQVVTGEQRPCLQTQLAYNRGWVCKIPQHKGFTSPNVALLFHIAVDCCQVLAYMHMLNWCLLSATNVHPRRGIVPSFLLSGTVPSFLGESSRRLLWALALLRACCVQRPNGLAQHSRQENVFLLATAGWC